MKRTFCLVQIKNTSSSYGAVAKLLHWVVAVLILGLLAVGLYMTSIEGDGRYKLYAIHKATGILVLVLVLIRLGWRFINVQPFYPDDMPLIQKFAAHMLHAALYFFIIFIPLSGWIMSSAGAHTISFYGLFNVPFIVDKNPEIGKLFNSLHELFAYILIGMLVIHISAALFHHFIQKDNILTRMLPGGSRNS